MNSFIPPDEAALTQKFLAQGYIIQEAESREDLLAIRECVVASSYAHLGLKRSGPDDPLPSIDAAGLNNLKLAVMASLHGPAIRESYYRLARNLIHALIGNELAMQKKFGLAVQLPGDDGNLLPIHADTWVGDSPYQLVVWVPLVDCYRTKSMWVLPPGEAFAMKGSSEETFRSIESRVKYLEVKFGEVLFFNPTLPHGNRVNEEDSARWSLNCRFKNLWSPWAMKGAGERFEPITLRAASRIGMDYEHPEVA